MRILLAEDEKELSKALVKVLELNHYCVDAVYNGQDALDYLMSDLYDAAILDIMMPKLDGLTVLRRSRAAQKTLPILLLTAKAGIDDRVEGLDQGADDYLTKPFAMKELLARLRAITRRNDGSAENILTVGDIILDRSSFVLKCADRCTNLASKEYQMFEMLMRHQGNKISTEQFMESVWGFNSEADINVVWVYLSKLRKILSEMNSTVKLVSARGQGYYLEEEHDPRT